MCPIQSRRPLCHHLGCPLHLSKLLPSSLYTGPFSLHLSPHLSLPPWHHFLLRRLLSSTNSRLLSKSWFSRLQMIPTPLNRLHPKLSLHQRHSLLRPSPSSPLPSSILSHLPSRMPSQALHVSLPQCHNRHSPQQPSRHPMLPQPKRRHINRVNHSLASHFNHVNLNLLLPSLSHRLFQARPQTLSLFPLLKWFKDCLLQKLSHLPLSLQLSHILQQHSHCPLFHNSSLPLSQPSLHLLQRSIHHPLSQQQVNPLSSQRQSRARKARRVCQSRFQLLIHPHGPVPACPGPPALPLMGTHFFRRHRPIHHICTTLLPCRRIHSTPPARWPRGLCTRRTTAHRPAHTRAPSLYRLATSLPTSPAISLLWAPCLLGLATSRRGWRLEARRGQWRSTWMRASR
jgi:hypothetical protein